MGTDVAHQAITNDQNSPTDYQTFKLNNRVGNRFTV